MNANARDALVTRPDRTRLTPGPHSEGTGADLVYFVRTDLGTTFVEDGPRDRSPTTDAEHDIGPVAA